MSKFAKFAGLLLASTIALPAQAQTKDADQQRLERKLDELRAMREQMQRQTGALQQQMGEFDSQIDAVESELRGGQPSTAQAQAPATPGTPAPGSTTAQQSATPPVVPSYPAETQRQAETE